MNVFNHPGPLSAAAGRLVRRGGSTADDPDTAVAELAAQIALPQAGLVVFFCSADYDLPRLAAAVARHFPASPVLGCTTMGLISPQGYHRRGVAGVAFCGSILRAEPALIENIGNLRVTECRSRTQAVTASLERRMGRPLDRATSFAFLLCDGLTQNEERVVSAMSSALGGIPLVGGSAGDDLRFQTTGIYFNGRFRESVALLVVAETRLPFRAFTTHHLEITEQRMVVTHAEPAQRLVRGINGAPAAEEFARLLGLSVDDLTPEVLAANAPLIRIGENVYVRSIIGPRPDGALIFGCAVDTGMVLRIGRTGDLVGNLDTALRRVRREVGPLSVVLGCDCAFRQVEMERNDLTAEVGRTLTEFRAVGFSSYGEQINSMHLNQTFTGVAFGSVPGGPEWDDA